MSFQIICYYHTFPMAKHQVRSASLHILCWLILILILKVLLLAITFKFKFISILLSLILRGILSSPKFFFAMDTLCSKMIFLTIARNNTNCIGYFYNCSIRNIEMLDSGIWIAQKMICYFSNKLAGQIKNALKKSVIANFK